MKRSWLVAVGLALALLALVGGVWEVTRPSVLRVAVGPEGGEDAALMHAFAAALDRQKSPVRIAITSTKGVMESAAALDGGQAELAVVRPDAALPATGQTVAILHRNPAVLMVPKDSKVEDVAALNGKTVAVLPANPANEALLDAILAQYDVPAHGVTRIGLSPDAVDEAVRDKRIDAVLAVGPVTGPTLTEIVAGLTAAAGGPPDFLAIEEAEAIAQRRIALEAVSVVRGAFGGSPPRPEEPLSTIGVSYRLVASTDAPETEVTELMEWMPPPDGIAMCQSDVRQNVT